MAVTPQKFNVWQPPFHGEGHLAISLKNIFDGNYMKCTELHETHIFQFSAPPQMVGNLGFSAQNNAMSGTKMLLNCPKTLPYFEFAKHEFSVKFWTSHS